MHWDDGYAPIRVSKEVMASHDSKNLETGSTESDKDLLLSCLARLDLLLDFPHGPAADDLEVEMGLHIQPVFGAEPEVAPQAQ